MPGIITFPGSIQPAKTAALMSGLDILPTVLGLAGLQSSLLDGVMLDGHDLSKTLLENQPSPRQEIVYIQSSATKNFEKIHALRRGDYKAHFYTEGNIFSANEDIDCIGLRQVGSATGEVESDLSFERSTPPRYCTIWPMILQRGGD